MIFFSVHYEVSATGQTLRFAQRDNFRNLDFFNNLPSRFFVIPERFYRESRLFKSLDSGWNHAGMTDL